MLNNLKIGSIIQFSTLRQSELSNKKFTISEINKYKFENATHTSFKITNESSSFYISDFSTEHQTNISVSRILIDEEVSMYFNLKEFALVFSNNVNCSFTTKNNTHPELLNWLDKVYTKHFDYVEGRYYSNNNSPQVEKFCYYTLTSNNSAIDIEVFESGQVTFYVTVYIPYEVAVKHIK